MNTEHYASLLRAELETITKDLESISVHSKKVDADWIPTPAEPVHAEPDPNDQADAHEDAEEQRSTTEALEIRFNNIKRALAKIENGTYGICEISGEPIEEDRLNANPAARTNKAHIDDEDQLLN